MGVAGSVPPTSTVSPRRRPGSSLRSVLPSRAWKHPRVDSGLRRNDTLGGLWFTAFGSPSSALRAPSPTRGEGSSTSIAVRPSPLMGEARMRGGREASALEKGPVPSEPAVQSPLPAAKCHGHFAVASAALKSSRFRRSRPLQQSARRSNDASRLHRHYGSRVNECGTAARSCFTSRTAAAGSIRRLAWQRRRGGGCRRAGSGDARRR